MLKVLLVQDNSVRAMAMKKYVSKAFDDNRIIIVAKDGREGVIEFGNDKENFDFIIMDYQMPNMLGDESIREIRKIKSDVKVLAWTTEKDRTKIDSMIAAGVSGFLPPYCNASELKKSLEKLKFIGTNSHEGSHHVASRNAHVFAEFNKNVSSIENVLGNFSLC